MYECRCLKCSKKLAEISRRTVFDFVYSENCLCGKGVMGEVSLKQDKKHKTIGCLVSIKCKRCKTISTF